MNIFEKEPEQEQESLEGFQQEIENLRNEEIEEKGKKANPNLTNTEVKKLTEDDMRAWQNYKKLTADDITKKDIHDFTKYKRLAYSANEPARDNFAAFLGNRLTILWGKKELKRTEK